MRARGGVGVARALARDERRPRRRFRSRWRRSAGGLAAVAAPRGRHGDARPGRAGWPERSSRCAAPVARATRRPRPSAAGSRPRATARCCSSRWRVARPGAARRRSRPAGPGRGAGRSVPPPGPLPPRGRARLAEVADRGRRRARRRAARCGRRWRAAAARSTGRRRARWPGCGPTSRSALDRPAPSSGCVARLGSPRVDAFCAALSASSSPAATSRACCAASPRPPPSASGIVADARSATAQARFTGLLVVAMPVGAALLAELLTPGFVAGCSPTRRPLVCWRSPRLLQLAGFAAIRRLGGRRRLSAGVSLAIAVLLGPSGSPAARELREPLRRRRTARSAAAARRAGVARRARCASGALRADDRAGLGGRLSRGPVMAAKLAGAALGGLAALVARSGLVPHRLAPVGR